MALLLLDGRRLLAVFVTHRAVPPAEHRPLLTRRRWRIAGTAFAVLLVDGAASPYW